MRVPAGPEDLTAQWLTQALWISGTIQKAKVLSVRADAVGQEKGITDPDAVAFLPE